jgi:Polysaccharide lyase
MPVSLVRSVLLRNLISFGPILAGGMLLLTFSGIAADPPPVKEDFEADVGSMFEICHRPENTIELSKDKARSGKQSLRLTIEPQALFDTMRMDLFELKPKSCLLEVKTRGHYWNDNYERAELWENRDRSPIYGEAMYYGFSMWVEPNAAPIGDYNRLVIAQWKASCNVDCDHSPFLSLRFMGGFFHITLDVDAKVVKGETSKTSPKTCKMLLAYAAGPPSPYESQLDLERDEQCETRLEWHRNRVEPIEKIEIDRQDYLPNPFGQWTDWVFRVEAGVSNGVIEVWNAKTKTLIARATGKIGHKDHAGEAQYFKFGPYRDPASYPATAYIDNLARGRTFDEVDPTKLK